MLVRQQKESDNMHIYGVGGTGYYGNSVKRMMNEKYNEEVGRRTGEAFDQKRIFATVNAEVVSARLTIESNRVANIRRPFMTVKSEVRDIWGDITDDVDHVSFLSENRPSFIYQYPLSDSEIKGLVDAGMFRNERFEPVLNKLMEVEQYEIAHDVSLQALTLIQDNERIPIVLVHDMGHIVHDPDGENTYSTFGSLIERTVEMARQLELDGVSADLLTQDEIDVDQEVTLDVDQELDVASIEDEPLRDDLSVLEQDLEIDLSESINPTSLFGQTSEEQRIIQMKEASHSGSFNQLLDELDNPNLGDNLDVFGLDDIADEDDRDSWATQQNTMMQFIDDAFEQEHDSSDIAFESDDDDLEL